jgi:hypothetical protein
MEYSTECNILIFSDIFVTDNIFTEENITFLRKRILDIQKRLRNKAIDR